MAKSLPKIEKLNNVGGQFEKLWFVWSGSAGEAVCWGGERAGVMLPEFEDFTVEHSVKDSARRSEGGGGSMSCRLFRRPQILFASVIVFMCLG